MILGSLMFNCVISLGRRRGEGGKSSQLAMRRLRGKDKKGNKDKKGTKRGEDGETGDTRNSARLMGIILKKFIYATSMH